ncbi:MULTISPECIES: DUF3558 family protein [Actinosynnema]|uniref:DUF3558 family protein n=1 Tax=Actinosynnema TaxID=40566 RepID=UPI0020A5E5DF|nr:DUF3558 family protein [Actinosynnema pretiosum]
MTATIALAIGALALTACTVSGTPKAAESAHTGTTTASTGATTTSSSPLAGLKACPLLSAEDIRENNLTNEEEEVQAGDPICSWSNRVDGGGFTVGIQANTGTSELNFSGREIERITIGEYSGIKSITPTSLTRCTVFIEVTSKATIDITTNNTDKGDVTDSCNRAIKLAESIASRLP